MGSKMKPKTRVKRVLKTGGSGATAEMQIFSSAPARLGANDVRVNCEAFHPGSGHKKYSGRIAPRSDSLSRSKNKQLNQKRLCHY